jgi:hypothetical protein
MTFICVGLIRQFVTSDVTISLFTGNKFVTCRGHASNTYGIGGETSRAPDSEGTGREYGVVVYEDGILKISAQENAETSEVPFHRLMIYHTFYKV